MSNTRPRGTRSRYAARLDAAEKKQIVAWSRAGVTQREIAVRLRCDTGTIRKWQVRLGVAISRRPLDEQAKREIRELHEEGLGSRRIAKRTGFGARTVLKVLHESGIKLKTGGPSIPKAKRAELDAAILRREDYACRIAKRLRLGTETVRRRVHKLLGPARLLSSPVWPPLQSSYPQENLDALLKTFDAKKASPGQYVTLVQRVLEKSFGGQFPFAREHDTHFIAALLVAFQRCIPQFEGKPQPVLDSFHTGLREAVVAVRLEQTASSDLVN